MPVAAGMEDKARTLVPAMTDARDGFMELVDDIRPELHRYAARMTGSAIDGEDVVQETLAKAFYALAQMTEPPNLRPWLFRIAHNTAMDFLKRYERRHVELVADAPDRAAPAGDDDAVDPSLVEAALTVFVELPPVQRSALLLKDVLGPSLEQTADTMGTTVGAVKSALSRARHTLAVTPRAVLDRPAAPASAEEAVMLRRYVALFNARDWDGLRALLAEEAQLDIVSRVKQRAIRAGYYERYRELVKSEHLRAESGVVDGLPAVAIFRPGQDAQPAYFIIIASEGGRLISIRDFRYVPYVAAGARYRPA